MILPLKRYFDFSGRSRRKEYWSYFLFLVIALIVMMLLDTKLGLGGTTDTYAEYGDAGASAGVKMTGGLLTLLFALATLIPSIAVAVRRAHDQDKSGWFILIPIYNLIMMFIEGTRGPNRFGPDPKAGDAEGRTAAA
jgi:uncharacterized membrane protein YhaH (DUF805 family)